MIHLTSVGVAKGIASAKKSSQRTNISKESVIIAVLSVFVRMRTPTQKSSIYAGIGGGNETTVN